MKINTINSLTEGRFPFCNIKKMKLFYSFLVIASVIFSCSKDEVATDQQYSFIKFYGMGSTSEGCDVKQLSDDSYIIFGTCTTADSGTDLFLIKVDKYGNEIWKKNFGTKYNETGYSMQPIPSGGYILLGTTQTNGSSGKLNTNIFLARTNNEGNSIIWKRTIGGDTTMIGYNIQITSSGGFIITGNAADATGNYLLNVITDADGNNQYVNLQLYSIVTKQIINIDDGYLSVGTISKTTGINMVINLKGGTDICITHTNNQGKSYFVFNTGGAGTDEGECLKKLSDGSFLCLGTDSGSRIRLTKFTISGEYHSILWDKLYSSNGAIYNSKGMEVFSDNEYAIAGAIGVAPNQDIFFLRVDSTGNKISEIKTYIGNGNQSCSKIIKTNEGGFAIVGTNEYSGYSVISLFKVKSNGDF